MFLCPVCRFLTLNLQVVHYNTYIFVLIMRTTPLISNIFMFGSVSVESKAFSIVGEV